jgi:hypothetical protein
MAGLLCQSVAQLNRAGTLSSSEAGHLNVRCGEQLRDHHTADTYLTRTPEQDVLIAQIIDITLTSWGRPKAELNIF